MSVWWGRPWNGWCFGTDGTKQVRGLLIGKRIAIRSCVLIDRYIILQRYSKLLRSSF